MVSGRGGVASGRGGVASAGVGVASAGVGVASAGVGVASAGGGVATNVFPAPPNVRIVTQNFLHVCVCMYIHTRILY